MIVSRYHIHFTPLQAVRAVEQARCIKTPSTSRAAIPCFYTPTIPHSVRAPSLNTNDFACEFVIPAAVSTLPRPRCPEIFLAPPLSYIDNQLWRLRDGLSPVRMAHGGRACRRCGRPGWSTGNAETRFVDVFVGCADVASWLARRSCWVLFYSTLIENIELSTICSLTAPVL